MLFFELNADIIPLMAKRDTGVGKRKKVRSPKTAKRLAAKAEMLDTLAKKRGYKGKRKPKDQ